MKNSKSTKRGLAALALVLAGGIAAGGTLAYLSDQTATVTNTFTAKSSLVEDSKTDFLLDESKEFEKINGSYVIKGTERVENGYKYENIVPGTTLAKDPRVLVDDVQENAYLYVVVNDSLQDDLTWEFLETNWKKVKSDTDQTAKPEKTRTLYVYTGGGESAKVVTPEDTKGEAKIDLHLMKEDKITVESSFTAAENIGDLSFKAYLVQAEGWNGTDDDAKSTAAWDEVFADDAGIRVVPKAAE